MIPKGLFVRVPGFAARAPVQKRILAAHSGVSEVKPQMLVKTIATLVLIAAIMGQGIYGCRGGGSTPSSSGGSTPSSNGSNPAPSNGSNLGASNGSNPGPSISCNP